MNKRIQYFWKLCIFYFILHICVAKRYDNYTLYRGIPITPKHLKFFKNLPRQFEVNYWRDPSKLNKSIEFTIPPEQKDLFLRMAMVEDVFITTLIDDVQKAFDKQTVKSYIRRRMESFDWSNYFRIDDINEWLNDVCKKHPNEVSCLSIGKSFEKRNIRGVRIYLKDGPQHRATVIVEGGIHAREWISPAFVTYFLNEIIYSSNSSDRNLRTIGAHYEWFFIPVLNPDGYEYSHRTNRLWRKNKRGAGVDLNRNFGFKFGTVGVSYEPNSEVFCGPEAFSEPESAAMKKFIDEHSEHLDYYLSFHSYGQYIIIPYAHSKKYLENFNEVRKIANRAANQIASYHGARYTTGTAYDTVGYLVAGSSICWTKSEYHVPFVMTIELRDQGTFGFALPVEYILPTCQETMLGMVSLLTPKNHTRSHIIRDKNLLYVTDGQENKFLDTVLIVCNIVLFNIVRFD